VIRHRGVRAMALIALGSGLVYPCHRSPPIYDATTRTFAYVASLHPGDKLLKPSGKLVAVKGVKHSTSTLVLPVKELVRQERAASSATKPQKLLYMSKLLPAFSYIRPYSLDFALKPLPRNTSNLNVR
jgi:hypothetical protein